MTDARWSEVEGDLANACRHFDFAARPFEAGGFEDAGLDGYRARMGFQHAMRAAHTSVEGALVRILPCIDAFRERIDPPEAPRPG